MRVLILGGYGTFGGRLAVLLADSPAITLIIAGRALDKARAFAGSLPAGAEKLALAFDRDGDVLAQLHAIAPDLVVDASGPFQAYGAQPYRVVEAALELGIDYLDLADGSEFVTGIKQFDEAARQRNVFILAGVSSFPVLTAAVVRHLAKDFRQLHSITGGIAPSPYAGVGLNVIRAIASYAGQPVRVIRDGGPATGYAITEIRRYTICPPGKLPLENIRFSLVDVPDLRALPELWPNLQSIWMGAGPVPEILHRAMNILAWMVRAKLLPSLSPFAGIFHRAINLLRWGPHRGGMFVAVEGLDADGSRCEKSWHLLAEGDDGPLIPSMAAEAIIRHCLSGRRPPSGARAATTDLELADYAALFARRSILTGSREVTARTADWPLYRRILGDAWEMLPVPLREMHDLQRDLTVEGVAAIDRGANPLVRFIASLFRFPAAGTDVPVRVDFKRADGIEVWRRSFSGRGFLSTQAAGRGRWDKLIVERFGPFAFGLAVVLEADRLDLVLGRWSCLGLPLPLSWAPQGRAYEAGEGGRFNFHVEIGHPWTGLIVRYRGWLTKRLDESQQ